VSWRVFWVWGRSAFNLNSPRPQQLAKSSASRFRDPYQVLGVTSSATADDIKRSFRARAKTLHPDANKADPRAAARFAELNSAYEILRHEGKREAFDRGDIDAQGKPLIPWRPRIVTAIIACSALASLWLFVAKPTPHAMAPDLREELADTATIQPIGALAELPLFLQLYLPRAVELAQPQARMDAKQIEFLIQRGQDLISEGDVAAARVLLRRAAEADNARAAITLGATYDPVVLGVLRAYGVAADLPQARFWYTRASELGSQEAQVRLNLLPKQ
jgi:TPR repeat protein